MCYWFSPPFSLPCYIVLNLESVVTNITSIYCIVNGLSNKKKTQAFLVLLVFLAAKTQPAQQVLMSVRPCVCPCVVNLKIFLSTSFYNIQNVPECSRMFQNACRMFQNVPECMQKVPECSRMHAECSRLIQNACRISQSGCRMFQNVPE